MSYRVVFGLTSGQISGVDVFSVNLARRFNELGIPAHVLLSQSAESPLSLPLPPDVPCETLPVKPRQLWATRWRTMIRYLEAHAPCIYLPNYDYQYSCVSPRLSARVGIVGIVHSDDPFHYEHVSRLGRYWNAIVAVSEAVAARTAALDPSLGGRLVTIPYGVSVPSELPDRLVQPEAPLRIVYAGRLVQEQKRVLDLAPVLNRLCARRVPVRLTIVGDGPDRPELARRLAPLVAQGVVRFLGALSNPEVLAIFEQSDAMVLTSAFEGLPMSVLEAMGRGCVPVVTDVRSGIPELIRDGVNGFRVPVGDARLLADRLRLLHRDIARRRDMAKQAHRTVASGRYHLDAVARAYTALFERVLDEARQGLYRRPSGAIAYPPTLSVSWKDWLPAPVRAAGSFAKQWARRALARTPVLGSPHA